MPYLWINEATEIKLLLAEGYPQAEIAARFKVSQATVSRILTGDQWADAPWPDGLKGGAPPELMRSIWDKRRNSDGVRTLKDAPNSPPEEPRTVESIAKIERIQTEVDDDILRKAVEEGGRVPAKGGKKKQRVQYDTLAWDLVVLRGGSHPLVEAVEAGAGLHKMKEAIQIVFAARPEDEWYLDGTNRLVESVRLTLIKEDKS